MLSTNCPSSSNSEKRHNRLLKEIAEHKKDGTALDVADGSHMTRTENLTPKRATKDWKLPIEWKHGGRIWMSSVDLKEACPLQVSEYAIANNISHEPLFNWWVHEALKRRDRIINKTKAKY